MDKKRICKQCDVLFVLSSWTEICEKCNGIFCRECSDKGVLSEVCGLDEEFLCETCYAQTPGSPKFEVDKIKRMFHPTGVPFVSSINGPAKNTFDSNVMYEAEEA